MSSSNFDKNGVNSSGLHWLQYASFVKTAFTIYFGWFFFNDANFHHFAEKYSSSGIAMDITPLNYFLMRWKVDFYP